MNHHVIVLQDITIHVEITLSVIQMVQAMEKVQSSLMKKQDVKLPIVKNVTGIVKLVTILAIVKFVLMTE